MLLPILICLYAITCGASNVKDNEIEQQTSRGITNGEELLEAVFGDCFTGEEKGVSVMSCLRLKVLSYLDSATGTEDARAMEDSDVEHLDAMILSRVARYLKTHQFKVQLPEFLFQEAILTFRPGKSLTDFKVEFPKEDDSGDVAVSEARGMLKKKLLLPLLLLVKLKMKVLMPIFVAIIGIKALKALILSKLAILLVAGFLVMQLCKKAGMPMPMVEPAAPPTAYGPVNGGPSTPSSSYEPSWDPSASAGGPYSRVYDPHQMAYSSYYSQHQQTQQSQPSQQS